MKSSLQLLGVLLGLSYSLAAIAETPAAKTQGPLPELTAYFDKRINQMQAAMAGYEVASDDPSMSLQAVSVSVAPSASFGLGGVLSLTVSPEISFTITPEN